MDFNLSALTAAPPLGQLLDSKIGPPFILRQGIKIIRNGRRSRSPPEWTHQHRVDVLVGQSTLPAFQTISVGLYDILTESNGDPDPDDSGW